MITANCQALVYLSSCLFFYIGVHFGNLAFNKLTGLEDLLFSQHLQYSTYEGKTRLKILNNLDIAIANRKAYEAIQDSKDLNAQYSIERMNPLKAEMQRDTPASLSNKSKYGVLNSTEFHEGIHIPMVYRRSMKDVENYVRYVKWTPNYEEKKGDQQQEDTPEFNSLEVPEPEKTTKSPLSKNTPNPDQTQLIILTYYRAGSSFFGQIFNQHPEVFYNFEPLYPYGRDCTSKIKDKVDLLENLLSCNYKDGTEWSEKYTNEGLNVGRPLTYNDKSCIAHNTCFRINSKAFCSKELCLQPVDPPSVPCSYCGPLNLQLTKKECDKKKVHAIKVIRICHLSWLVKLRHKFPRLKIIHLLRDPRALAASRMRLHLSDENFDIMKNITEECKSQFSNFVENQEDSTQASIREKREVGEEHTENVEDEDEEEEEEDQNDLQNWLNNNYLEVKYEDVADDPIEIAKKVLDFVNLNYDPIVDKWLKQHGGANSGSGINNGPPVEAQMFSAEADLVNGGLLAERGVGKSGNPTGTGNHNQIDDMPSMEQSYRPSQVIVNNNNLNNLFKTVGKKLKKKRRRRRSAVKTRAVNKRKKHKNHKKFTKTRRKRSNEIPIRILDATNIDEFKNEHKPVLWKTFEFENRKIMSYVYSDTKLPAYNRTILRQESNQPVERLRNDNNLDPMSKNYKLPSRKQKKIGGGGRHYVNPFSTNRKSSSLTAQSWRKTLPLEIAKNIENNEHCRNMMGTYGYSKLPENISEENYADIDGFKIEFF